jgi:hypothetical protein
VSQAEDTRFEVVPHGGGFQPGIDIDRLNQLLDQLDVSDYLVRAQPGSE